MSEEDEGREKEGRSEKMGKEREDEEGGDQ